MTCNDCGSTEVMAFWPGQEGESSDLFRLIPSRVMKGWCAQCWQKRYTQECAPPRSGGRAKKPTLTHD